jgi:hypothetical protein
MTQQILAQGGRLLAGWTLESIFIAIIIVACAVGVVYVILRAVGVSIPPWVVNIFWILAAAFIGILAIRLLFSL